MLTRSSNLNVFRRSVLIVRLIKAESLPKNEENEINYYMVVTLFPQRERLFQSAVYKTSTPQFQECFEFTIPLNDLLLQSLKFTLWTFDCFSPHEVVADAFVRLQRLESYGLSTCREICLAKNLQLEEKASYYDTDHTDPSPFHFLSNKKVDSRLPHISFFVHLVHLRS